ncbi:MAG: endopeptidase La [Selenomonas sp.]|uniref:endopeptidase La n=1 Tax=Selenomonas sp. TaxID=2053611 RepID=UPI0025EBCD46|nr:endopeptidase La [Selenomonas sp.]MCI6233334.1 endopeptidase La [Selenomonas sp.]
MTSQIRTMPLIPMRGMLVFPYMMIHLDIGRPASIAALEQAMLTDHEVLLVTQRDAGVDEPKERDLYEVGTVAEVQRLVKLPDGSVRILAEGQTRGKIRIYRELEGYVEAEVDTYEDDDEPLGAHTVENDALVRSVIDQFEQWVKASGKVPPEALVSVAFVDDAGRMADLIASHLNLRLETRQELLSCIDVRERLEKLSSVLARELEILEIEKKIDARVHEHMTKTQKEYYLREKIKSIREELGEDSQRSAEVAEYRKRLEEGPYPDDVKKVVERELQRMEAMSERSPENDVIRTYLDWLLDLPWQQESKEQLDIRAARDVLERDHYGLKEIKERILDYLAVRQLMPEKAAPILCLVGPPGVGKTSLGSSIARATGRKFVHVSLGGVRDEAEIRGHRRTYIGAMPGRIIEGIRSVKAKNPVFLLDEIDKLAESYQGDPAAALLEVLDPAQNQEFVDHYLDVPFDLSHVLWIVTANNLGNIPRPLRDRMEILTLSSYTEYEKLVIARRYLVPRQRTENGLKAKDIRFGTGVLEETIASYTRESGVRELERLIGRICRKAARHIVEGEETPIRVTKKQLADYLGKPKYLETKAEKQPQVGVVTGMAWTEVGGDILPTEVIVLKGKGKLILTGQLGDVMQESAQAGLTYVRSRADVLHLPEDFYENDDIHIHLPEGAIPKDGPSAGITMATGLVSALLGRKVRSDVAMTGEITLRGNVLPIGGLKEKVLAAYREGIHTIILPKENERDLEDLPEDIRKKMEFHLVEHMDEVLKIALLPAEKTKTQKEATDGTKE